MCRFVVFVIITSSPQPKKNCHRSRIIFAVIFLLLFSFGVLFCSFIQTGGTANDIRYIATAVKRMAEWYAVAVYIDAIQQHNQENEK